MNETNNEAEFSAERRAGFEYLDCESYRYHELTKHSLKSLYSSPGGLDWALQPDPFRVYEGTQKIVLPRELLSHDLDLFQLIRLMLAGQKAQMDGPDIVVQPPASGRDQSFVSSLLYYSMAISAWKQIRGTDSKWALRVNPSSGNLHPTETHLLIRNFADIEDGAYHYSVKEHSLEVRASGAILDNVWNLLEIPEGSAPPMMLVLTSIFWREAWKYRDRAFRYCQLDLGHAAAAVCLSAAGFGWRSEVLAEFPDREIRELLGLSDTDEQVMLLIPLYPGLVSRQETAASWQESAESRQDSADSRQDSAESRQDSAESRQDSAESRQDSAESRQDSTEENWNVKSCEFKGKPNRLSSSVRFYESINTVFKSGCLERSEWQGRKENLSRFAARGPLIAGALERIDISEASFTPERKVRALELIRKRRSAVDMDGQLRTSLARMVRILIDSSRGFSSPFSTTLPMVATETALPYFIHIILYVHRVAGIAPGIYCFDRLGLNLIPLNEADARSQAKFVSCLQDIASDGVFAVSLVADFREAFRCFGERAYRYIHQEAGFIGHLFYLTALALEIDATGIGCFLDDEINQSLPAGMETVYNFTFGRGVHDPRLTSLPAYDFD